MPQKYSWYEKFFFYLQFHEKACWKLLGILILMLIFSQLLLSDFRIRQYVVLTEKFEGRPVKFYKSLNSDHL